MIISLTGFMGCGKSSVGKELADRLGWEFTDLDKYIEYKIGLSISEIFSEGEEHFRAIEAEAVRDIITMKDIAGGDLVLALGGGTLTSGPIRRLILANSHCVWLKVSAAEACRRLEGDSTRPLFDPGSAASLLESRERTYALAEFFVDTEHNTVKETADTIFHRIFDK